MALLESAGTDYITRGEALVVNHRLSGLLGIVLGPIVLAMAASVLDLYTSQKRGDGAFPGDSGEAIGKNRATVLE